ncbi:hypothetical protein [Ekhidna sp.]|jgi:hypothetical protein|uniref:hypothetical protein n=1 Tax=Ekhidna sp. TaxID=2608089 RepID=UPI003B5CC862
MGIKRYLNLLRISLLVLFPLVGHSQKWEKVKSWQATKQPTAFSVDYQNNIYMGFSDGGLTKYDSEGELLENFSLSNASSVVLIDVQNNLKPFLFYFDNQQITILDRFSTVPKNYFLADFDVQLGMMACPAPDGNFWVVENNPQRLKKISPLRKSTVLEVQLQLGDSINKMQAYQNLLFISHTNGLHVLDQFGGKIYSVDLLGTTGFQLIGNKVLVFSKMKITRLNFTGEVETELYKPELSEGTLKVKESFLFIKDRTINFYNPID